MSPCCTGVSSIARGRFCAAVPGRPHWDAKMDPAAAFVPTVCACEYLLGYQELGIHRCVPRDSPAVERHSLGDTPRAEQQFLLYALADQSHIHVNRTARLVQRLAWLPEHVRTVADLGATLTRHSHAESMRLVTALLSWRV